TAKHTHSFDRGRELQLAALSSSPGYTRECPHLVDCIRDFRNTLGWLGTRGLFRVVGSSCYLRETLLGLDDYFIDLVFRCRIDGPLERLLCLLISAKGPISLADVVVVVCLQRCGQVRCK